MKPKFGLRPGTKLSEHYNNRNDCYKVVETDHVFAYVVSGGGRDSVAAIYPLYRADIHIKAGKTWHIVSSYEQGDRLNDYTFQTDYEGCTFALIASQSVNALLERQRAQQIVKQADANKRPRKRGR